MARLLLKIERIVVVKDATKLGCVVVVIGERGGEVGRGVEEGVDRTPGRPTGVLLLGQGRLGAGDLVLVVGGGRRGQGRHLLGRGGLAGRGLSRPNIAWIP